MALSEKDVVKIIEKEGPVLPAEITAELNTNTIILSAVLSELVKDGEVKFSHKKIGNSPLYFIPGQEKDVRERLLSHLKLPEKKVLEFFKKNKLVLKSNLTPQQRFVVNQLKDFVKPVEIKIKGDEKTFYKYYSLKMSVIEDELKRMSNPKKKKKKKKKKKEEKKSQKKLVEDDEELKINNQVQKIFEKLNIKPLSKEVIRKGSEVDYIGITRDDISQKYLIKFKKRKRLNDKDLSLYFLKSLEEKMPCIIVTKARLTKKAKKMMETDIGEMVKVVKL